MYDTLLNISKHRRGDGKAKFYLFERSEKKADNVITYFPLHSNLPLKRVAIFFKIANSSALNLCHCSSHTPSTAISGLAKEAFKQPILVMSRCGLFLNSLNIFPQQTTDDRPSSVVRLHILPFRMDSDFTYRRSSTSSTAV